MYVNLYCVGCGDGDSFAGVAVTHITDSVAAEISFSLGTRNPWWRYEQGWFLLRLLSFCGWLCSLWGFPDETVVKNPPANVGDSGDVGSIPGSERSPRGGNGNLFQYSWLKNPMGRGAWWATVWGVARSRTWLSDQHFHFLSGLCLRRARLRKHLPNVKN